MKLIVGLGNPGRQYEQTRHNVGFMVLDELASRLNIPCTKADWHAVYGKGASGREEVVLAKPLTYMNRSGESVSPMLQWFKIQPEDLIVVCDDIHLPIGQLRIRQRGSDGGHNGLKSVIHQTGSDLFARVRLGVGSPPPGFDQADYVLSRFSREERESLELMVKEAADAVELILNQGLPTTMNRYNQRKNNNTGEKSL